MFKTVWNNWNKGKYWAKIRFYADNSGSLYANGQLICSGVDYKKGWNGEIDLAGNDVITAECFDDDQPGEKTAGFFFSAVVDGETILESRSFHGTFQSNLLSDKNRFLSTDFEGFKPVSQRLLFYKLLNEFNIGNVRVLSK